MFRVPFFTSQRRYSHLPGEASWTHSFVFLATILGLNLIFEPPAVASPRVDDRLSRRPFGGAIGLLSIGRGGSSGSGSAAGAAVLEASPAVTSALSPASASSAEGLAAAPRRGTGFGFAFGALGGIMVVVWFECVTRRRRKVWWGECAKLLLGSRKARAQLTCELMTHELTRFFGVCSTNKAAMTIRLRVIDGDAKSSLLI
jgi:hypothetical protein